MYFVPHQDSIEQALQQLRRQEFARGCYYKRWPYTENEVPASLEELVARTTYRTHSILDIT
jgi:hypothetical protein